MVLEATAKDLERIAYRVAGETAGYLRDLYGIEELSEVIGRGASGDTTRRIDREVEDFAIDLLVNSGLDLLIVSEERGIVKASSSPRYIVLMDPLDGSLNYTLGIPAVAVSIVFYSVDEPYLCNAISGAVANVFLREVISFDDRNVYIDRVRVPGYKPSKSGIAVIYTNDPEAFRIIHGFMHEAYTWSTRLRVLGSAALESVYAGLGRIDLFFHNTGRLRNLDVAGGIAVARRLGAVATGLRGSLEGYRADRIEFLNSLIIGDKKVLGLRRLF